MSFVCDNVNTLLFNVVKFTRRRDSLFLRMVNLSISVYSEPERSNVDAVVFIAANAPDVLEKPTIPEAKLEATELESPP